MAVDEATASGISEIFAILQPLRRAAGLTSLCEDRSTQKVSRAQVADGVRKLIRGNGTAFLSDRARFSEHLAKLPSRGVNWRTARRARQEWIGRRGRAYYKL